MPKITDFGQARNFDRDASPASHVLAYLHHSPVPMESVQRLLVFNTTHEAIWLMAEKYIDMSGPDDAARIFTELREGLAESNLTAFEAAVTILAFVSPAYVGVRQNPPGEYEAAGEPKIGDSPEDADVKVAYAVVPGGGRTQSCLLSGDSTPSGDPTVVQIEADAIDTGHVASLPEQAWVALSELLEALNRHQGGSRA